MQPKTKKASILPVLLIAAVAGALSLLFLSSLRADTTVVVAARSIALGARLTDKDLTTKKVRQADALPNAVVDIKGAKDQVISIQRMTGDQITKDMLGNQAVSAIASSLAADHRAVAVKVTRASGLAGILRPGDYVTLIGVIKPGQQSTRPTAGAVISGTVAAVPTKCAGAGCPTPTPQVPGQIVPQTAFARVTATGLKVLLVPQTFRYEEVTTTDSQGFAQAQSSQVGQSESVIVLDVPVTALTLTGLEGPLTLTLPELIALLNSQAEVYLALEPASGAARAEFPGVAIEQIIDQGVGKGQP